MRRLMIKRGRSYIFIKLDNINWIERDGNYLRIHTDEESFLFRETLSAFENILPSESFTRINRSSIVNLDYIKELRIKEKSCYTVIMQNDLKQTWSRRYRENLKKTTHLSKENCLYNEKR